MSFNLVIGIVLIISTGLKLGTGINALIDVGSLVMVLILNISFIFSTRSQVTFKHLTKVTFISSYIEDEVYESLKKLNTCLLILNIAFASILYVISRLAIFHNTADLTTIPAIGASLMLMQVIILYFIVFLLLPQRYILYRSNQETNKESKSNSV